MMSQQIMYKIHKADCLHSLLNHRIHVESDPTKVAILRRRLNVVIETIFTLHETRRNLII